MVLGRVGDGPPAEVPEPAEFIPPTPRVVTLPRPMVEPGARTARAPEPGRVLACARTRAYIFANMFSSSPQQ